MKIKFIYTQIGIPYGDWWSFKTELWEDINFRFGFVFNVWFQLNDSTSAEKSQRNILSFFKIFPRFP